LFAVRFAELVTHTRLHFDYEQQLMRNFAFPAINEHTGEHQRVLGELTRFARPVETGRTHFARAYVREALPAWFHLHATTMDSALAAHLKVNRCLGVEVAVPCVSVSEQT
jgi:hemerythrin-like metal-binding protein